ncbi:hypothetical protein Acy02nite_23110 [Actinoplanes cyaneus]|uniref:Lipoprotein n=1 Tax=Actinoplanes cyaneus TaxID=52696 RepID=A0A919LZU1_9ACTN|nr:hypothetical protein [Actinoplanes cyaneus]MCW2136424.1 hypothetical protein [Actinoplanes cyaneus]GID64430.1 hypothetical protein Acy02nite_23110 [Actinoplanes cyaneus]
MHRFTAFAALLLPAGLVACGAENQPGTPAPAPSPVVSAAPADDPPGTLTCRALAAAVRDASLMEPGVIQAVVAAGGTADAPVADAAAALDEAYRKAVLSHGTQSEPDAIAAVSAAAADMSQVCADSGLDSAN